MLLMQMPVLIVALVSLLAQLALLARLNYIRKYINASSDSEGAFIYAQARGVEVCR